MPRGVFLISAVQWKMNRMQMNDARIRHTSAQSTININYRLHERKYTSMTVFFDATWHRSNLRGNNSINPELRFVDCHHLIWFDWRFICGPTELLHWVELIFEFIELRPVSQVSSIATITIYFHSFHKCMRQTQTIDELNVSYGKT